MIALSVRMRNLASKMGPRDEFPGTGQDGCTQIADLGPRTYRVLPARGQKGQGALSCRNEAFIMAQKRKEKEMNAAEAAESKTAGDFADIW